MFCPGFDREGVERLFLISNVSAGNIKLCRGQHITRELRVERACIMSTVPINLSVTGGLSLVDDSSLLGYYTMSSNY